MIHDSVWDFVFVRFHSSIHHVYVFYGVFCVANCNRMFYHAKNNIKDISFITLIFLFIQFIFVSKGYIRKIKTNQ